MKNSEVEEVSLRIAPDRIVKKMNHDHPLSHQHNSCLTGNDYHSTHFWHDMMILIPFTYHSLSRPIRKAASSVLQRS